MFICFCARGGGDRWFFWIELLWGCWVFWVIVLVYYVGLTFTTIYVKIYTCKELKSTSPQHQPIPTNSMKIIIASLISVLLTVSCVPMYQHRTYQQNPRAFQQGLQQQRRHLDSVTVSKVDTGKIGVRTKNATPGQRAVVKQYVISEYQRTGRIPSNEFLSRKYGFPVQTTGFIDTPDRVVKSIRVSPNELPPNIRARFQ